MPRVVGVRLRRKCQIYDFDAGDLELSSNDWVIVETARGHDAGQVVQVPEDVSPEEVQSELKAVVRRATAADLRRMRRFRKREGDVLERAQAKVAEAELPMRLVAAEYAYNGRSLTIFFTAERRVDFRALVKELAREFRTRIELRQIGSRDEARLIGGIGPCGRLLCCTTFLRDFLHISVRMAKEQDLPLSPMKISGVCGRLLCCLSYEHEQYRQIKAQLPSVDEEVVTLRGRGKVVGLNVPRETVTVEVRPGLAVEATVEELAQAAQLEAEGRLMPVQPSYVAVAIPEEKPPAEAEAPPSEKAKKRRRRRRRKKKETAVAREQPKDRRRPSQPKKAREQAAPAAPRKKRRRRPRRPSGGESSKGGKR